MKNSITKTFAFLIVLFLSSPNRLFAQAPSPQVDGISGYSGIIAIAVVLILIIAFTANSQSKKVAYLSLQEFRIDQSQNAETPVVIKGRTPGLLNWLLTLVKIDDQTAFYVKQDHISFKISSLSGESHQIVTFESIASIHCKYHKSIGFLIFAIGLFIAFAVALAVGFNYSYFALLVSVAFFLGYFFSTTIILSFETKGGLIMGIEFKRSVIENVSVDLKDVLKIIDIIKAKIIGGSQVTRSTKYNIEQQQLES